MCVFKWWFYNQRCLTEENKTCPLKVLLDCIRTGANHIYLKPKIMTTLWYYMEQTKISQCKLKFKLSKDDNTLKQAWFIVIFCISPGMNRLMKHAGLIPSKAYIGWQKATINPYARTRPFHHQWLSRVTPCPEYSANHPCWWIDHNLSVMDYSDSESFSTTIGHPWRPIPCNTDDPNATFKDEPMGDDDSNLE